MRGGIFAIGAVLFTFGVIISMPLTIPFFGNTNLSEFSLFLDSLLFNETYVAGETRIMNGSNVVEVRTRYGNQTMDSDAYILQALILRGLGMSMTIIGFILIIVGAVTSKKEPVQRVIYEEVKEVKDERE